MRQPAAHLLAGIQETVLDDLVRRLPAAANRPLRGRPWSHSLRDRVLIVCVALRTNLTIRELAVVFATSKSSIHRVLLTITPHLAAGFASTMPNTDRRHTWILDGTLIPTRDHRVAAKSKNYRWSCNAQILVRHRDLRLVAVAGGGPGNRNDPIHYRGSSIEAMCQHHRRVLADGGYRGVPELITPTFHRNRILRDRAWRRHRRRRARVEHVIAQLKTWRVLRDHRRRGHHLLATLRAVALLHNLRLLLRDNP